jgi:hypothetical protein
MMIDMNFCRIGIDEEPFDVISGFEALSAEEN